MARLALATNSRQAGAQRVDVVPRCRRVPRHAGRLVWPGFGLVFLRGIDK